MASSRDGDLLIRFSSVVTADVNRDFLLQLVEKSNQALLTEATELCPHDGRDIRLCESKPFRGFFLAESRFPDGRHHLNAKGGAGRECIRFIKPKISKEIA